MGYEYMSENRDVPEKEQTKGFSPVCDRRCAMRADREIC